MGTKLKLKHMEKVMKGLAGTNQLDPQQGQQGVLDDEPIAELFHNTSIMFSDIVGKGEISLFCVSPLGRTPFHVSFFFSPPLSFRFV